MSPSKILVTGATGFVGRHLVSALLARGYQVRAVARNLETAMTLPWFEQVEFVVADVHDLHLDIGALTEGVDAMAHLAWPGLPDYRALFHIEHNLPADYAFIKRAVQAGIAHVLVTGTCFEYGMQNGELTEDMAACPDNPYGLAKHTLRLFLETLRTQHPFTLQWPRLFYLHGPGQNPNSLLASLDRAIDEQAASFNMSAGDQLRDYLPIETAAGYLVDLLERPQSGGVINCCSGKPVSVRALVEQRVRERNATLTLNLGHYGYPTYEPMAFWGSDRRLRMIRDQAAQPSANRHGEGTTAECVQARQGR